MTNDSAIVCWLAEHPIKIHKWKVRDGAQVQRNHIVLLYQEQGDDADPKIKQYKTKQSGVVVKRLFKDGDIVNKGDGMFELGECIHTTVIKDMCADCGLDLRREENAGSGGPSEASVPMVHSVPELKVTQKLAQKLGRADTKRLLEDRKLVLLVDLDQTIIHTTNDNVPNNLKGVYHFQLYGPNSPWYHTRLRPGTFTFLNQMAAYYELHICTFGARNYAHMIAQFLDEDGKYFSHRILSRDECFNLTSKTDNLRALFPCGDSMVCIIDDREDVWNMASNLIQVKPYHFFQHTGDINAPPGMAKHELDGKGVNFKDLVTKDETGKGDKTADDKKLAESIEAKPPEDTEANDDEEQATSETNDALDKKSAEKSIIPVPALEDDSETLTENPSNSPAIIAVSCDDPMKCSSSESEDNLIEIEDPDDYLLYLEVTLKKIHSRFYEAYEKTQTIPDLKVLIPTIRSEVLVGKTLVFSRLVPNQLKLEQSKAYLIAKSLGANVTQRLTAETTHLVAATSGTFKEHAARKRSEISVVTPEWLWSCAERWECVEEKLFPLDPLKPSTMRQPPPHCHSPEHTVNYNDVGDSQPKPLTQRDDPRSSSKVGKTESAGSSDNDDDDDEEPKFIDTINPLLSFSNADLADMNQEFDQFFESDTSSDDEPVDIENPPIDKQLKRKRKQEDEKEEAEKRGKFFRSDAEELLLPVMQNAHNHAESRKTSVGKTVRLVPLVEGGPDNDREAAGDDDVLNVGHEDDAADGGSNSEKEGQDYGDDDDDDDEDEMPSARFRRGGDLPSDLDIGSDCGSVGSNEPIDEDDDGDWNMMGAALEREFLGLE